MIHQNCAEQNFPVWTLCHEEQQTLTKARNELKAKLSAAKTFQLREQGSMMKNTAIPAFADFDFILQVRNNSTTIAMVKDEIKEKFALIQDTKGNSKCHFIHGEGKIETWVFCEDTEVFFDVVIAYENDSKFRDWETSIESIKSLSPNVHSYIRALKYWCKRLQVPLKSFAIEYIAKHLYDTTRKLDFINFLEFLADQEKWKLVPQVSEVTEGNFPVLKEIALKALNFLRKP